MTVFTTVGFGADPLYTRACAHPRQPQTRRARACTHKGKPVSRGNVLSRLSNVVSWRLLQLRATFIVDKKNCPPWNNELCGSCAGDIFAINTSERVRQPATTVPAGHRRSASIGVSRKVPEGWLAFARMRSLLSKMGYDIILYCRRRKM